MGGIIGENYNGATCTNVYNIGNIDTNCEYKGNIIGKDNIFTLNSNLNEIYYLDNGLEAVGNRPELSQEGDAKNIEEMKKQSTYSGFDFENTWEIQENKFPVLKRSNHVYLTDINANNMNVEVEEEKTIKLSLTPEIVDDAVFKYSVDNEEIVTISDDGIVKGLKEGKATINIQTLDESVSETINVEVAAKRILTDIAIKTAPTVTTYFLGDSLNTEGLVLVATYDNGTTGEITEGFTCTPTTLNNIGEQTITVTYKDKTTTYNVTVGLKGDVNGDNLVDFMDILAINKHRLGKAQITGDNLDAADVTGDGKVDFMDILQINKYRLGKIDSL